MKDELKPLSHRQVELMLQLINELPTATKSEVGLLDATDVFNMIFKCGDEDFINAKSR